MGHAGVAEGHGCVDRLRRHLDGQRRLWSHGGPPRSPPPDPAVLRRHRHVQRSQCYDPGLLPARNHPPVRRDELRHWPARLHGALHRGDTDVLEDAHPSSFARPLHHGRVVQRRPCVVRRPGHAPPRLAMVAAHGGRSIRDLRHPRDFVLAPVPVIPRGQRRVRRGRESAGVHARRQPRRPHLRRVPGLAPTATKHSDAGNDRAIGRDLLPAADVLHHCGYLQHVHVEHGVLRLLVCLPAGRDGRRYGQLPGGEPYRRGFVGDSREHLGRRLRDVLAKEAGDHRVLARHQ
mmetsp:Transcript_80520/g.232722  ORF Transcript_80520/g.232722 Transcript_80520/m.232722 type:complete len:290 (-) Transcript_80520:441-1310(-)